MAVSKEVLSEVRPGLTQGTFIPGPIGIVGGQAELPTYADFGQSESIIHPLLLDRKGFLALNDAGLQDQVTVSHIIDIKSKRMKLPYLSAEDKAKVASEISARERALSDQRPDFEFSDVSYFEKYVFFNLDQAIDSNLDKKTRKKAFVNAMQYIQGDPVVIVAQLRTEIQRRESGAGYEEDRGMIGNYKKSRWDKDRLERSASEQMAKSRGEVSSYNPLHPGDAVRLGLQEYDGPKTAPILIYDDNEKVFDEKLAEKKWIASQPIEGVNIDRNTGYSSRAMVQEHEITRLSDSTDVQTLFDIGDAPRQDPNIDREFGDIDPNEAKVRRKARLLQILRGQSPTSAMPENIDMFDEPAPRDWKLDPHLASEQYHPASSEEEISVQASKIKAREARRKMGVTVFEGGSQSGPQEEMAETA